MSDIPLSVLGGALAVLLLFSAFFSSSETGMMALNRYRLKHLVRHQHRGARLTRALLDQPDRLIGLILLGNNVVNILASMLATIIAVRVMGDAGVVVAFVLLTLVVLVFAEVTPKTLAVLHPERIAFPAAYVLTPLLKVSYPFIWLVNQVSNGILRIFGVSLKSIDAEKLDSDELRTVVNEAGAMVSRRHKKMLLSILDLEHVAVDDIMVPRNEVHGIDLDDPGQTVIEHLLRSQHARLPLYRGDINKVVGVLHLRELVPAFQSGEISPEDLVAKAREPYFVPEGTPLNTQLLNFQRRHHRLGLVVDEYGDIQGLVTLEDILEEIVGEFTSDPADLISDVERQDDGSYLVDAGATIRELNRRMLWELPCDGPKTLNGLILEYLETIPSPGTSLLLAGYPVEIVQTTEHAVRTARIRPTLRKTPAEPPQGTAEE